MTAPLIQFGSPAAGPANDQLPAARVKLPPPPRPPSSTISVDGVVIPHAAISAEAQHHPASSPAEAFRLAAEALVVRQLLLAEARASRLDAVPEQDARGRTETEDDALIRALLEERVHTPTATAAECRRYYEAHPDRFTTDEICEAHHILVPVPDSGDEAARRRAEEEARAIIGRLEQNPEAFAALAREASACPSRMTGGSLGQLTRGATTPEFEAALARLSEGEITPEPVRTRFGYHVIRLDRRVAGSRLPFEAVQERIAVHLEAASWSRAVSQFIGVLAERAEISGFALGGSPHLSGGATA